MATVVPLIKRAAAAQLCLSRTRVMLGTRRPSLLWSRYGHALLLHCKKYSTSAISEVKKTKQQNINKEVKQVNRERSVNEVKVEPWIFRTEQGFFFYALAAYID